MATIIWTTVVVGQDDKDNYTSIKDAFVNEFSGSDNFSLSISMDAGFIGQKETDLSMCVFDNTTKRSVSLQTQTDNLYPAIISGNRADLLIGDKGDYLGVSIETLHDVYIRAIACIGANTKDGGQVSATEKAMLKLGGTLWVKNEMRRVYFSAAIIASVGGLEITRRRTGSVSDAKLNGVSISHSAGGGIEHQLGNIKVWYDCVEDKIFTKNVDALRSPSAITIADKFVRFLEDAMVLESN